MTCHVTADNPKVLTAALYPASVLTAGNPKVLTAALHPASSRDSSLDF